MGCKLAHWQCMPARVLLGRRRCLLPGFWGCTWMVGEVASFSQLIPTPPRPPFNPCKKDYCPIQQTSRSSKHVLRCSSTFQALCSFSFPLQGTKSALADTNQSCSQPSPARHWDQSYSSMPRYEEARNGRVGQELQVSGCGSKLNH